MNETEFMAKSVPASNQYKVNYESQARAVRVPRADLNRDKSPKNPMIAVKKDDSPSPVTYKDVDKNWNRMSQFPTTNFNYSICKEPKKSFLDQTIKAKAKIPQVGHYKDDGMKNFDMLSRGTNIPRYKKGR
jgi:hypothetical protein